MTKTNKFLIALQEIHREFLLLSKIIEKRSAALSDMEKKRASMFLYSAFDLVMESYVYKGDPAHPALTDWMKPYRKFGGDNPHTIYTQIPVDHHYSYVLKGRSGNAFYIGVQAYGYKAGYNLPTGFISLDDILPEKDGSFVLHLSVVRPSDAKNWICIQPKDHAIIIRQYFKGKLNNIPGKFTITRTDSSRYGSPPYLKRLDKARSMLKEYINGTLEVCDLLHKNAFNDYPKANAEVKKPKYGGALYPTKDNRYNGFWVSLKTGEAIHLHGRLPQNTPYASYVFYDRWYTTPDYISFRTYLTNDDIVLNKDGSFDIYISPEQIEHPNRIDTAGLYEGSYSSRYLLSESTEFPAAAPPCRADTSARRRLCTLFRSAHRDRREWDSPQASALKSRCGR